MINQLDKLIEMEEITEEEVSLLSSLKIKEEYKEPGFASFLRCLGCCFGFTCLPIGGCGCCYPYQSVDKGSRGVVQEFGRLKREVPDGMHYINPISEKMTIVNMKVQDIDLRKQNVMTSDGLSIDIDSVLYYQITNANDALFNVDGIEHAIKNLSYATLRNVVGNSELKTCLGQRQTIADLIKDNIDDLVKGWGVRIISIQIKDIIVPQNIIAALSSAVTAEREAEAKIITAKANVKSAELIRQSADMLNTPAAMQIRSLEVIDRLAHAPNTKIILLPSDLTLQSSLNANLVFDGIVNT